MLKWQGLRGQAHRPSHDWWDLALRVLELMGWRDHVVLVAGQYSSLLGCALLDGLVRDRQRRGLRTAVCFLFLIVLGIVGCKRVGRAGRAVKHKGVRVYTAGRSRKGRVRQCTRPFAPTTSSLDRCDQEPVLMGLIFNAIAAATSASPASPPPSAKGAASPRSSLLSPACVP